MQTVENYSGFPEPQKKSKANILNLSANLNKESHLILPSEYFVQFPR
jgi:hypothetical protein